MNVKKIIVGTDFSEQAQIAAGHAIAIAAALDAEVRIVHAIPSLYFYTPYPVGNISLYDTEFRRIVEASKLRLAKEVQKWRDKGANISLQHVTDQPAAAILTAADEFEADLVVVGTHGESGVSRFLLGSVAEKVARRAPCDVLVARGPVPTDGYRKLLVPTDFSEHSDLALKRSEELLGGKGAIDLLHCWQYPIAGPEVWGPSMVSLNEDIQKNTESAGALLTKPYSGGPIDVSFHQKEARARHGIEEYCKAGDFDLIVMGSHGRKGLTRIVLGSVAESTIRHAPVSVYVVRPKATN